MRKFICVLALLLCFCGFHDVTSAGNIPFDVTVGGTGSQDPLSKKAMKSNDGDNDAYYRATYVSNTTGYIMVESYNYRNRAIYTPQLTQLCSANLNQTRSRWYNVTAPGGEYYFMNSSTDGPRIRVKGYYCP